MNVHLTQEMKQLVEEEVTSGRYASASEVIREGLRLFMDERHWREEVRQKIAVGVAQARVGQLVDGDEAFGRVLARVNRPNKKRG